MQSPHQRPSGCCSLLFHVLRALLDKCDPRPPARCKSNRPVITFLPGQIGVLAEYPATLKLDNQQIINHVRLAFVRLQAREEVVWSARRVTILRGPDRTLALAFGDVPAARRDPARLLRFINQLNYLIIPTDTEPRRPSEPNNPDPKGEPYQQPGAQDPDTGATKRALRAGSAPAPDGFRLTAASPNWLSSGASQHGGTGGPGAWPVATTIPPSNSDTGASVQPWNFILPDGMNGPPAPASAVEVAILDTAPRPADLQSAYTRWVTGQQQPHALLAHLLGKGGSFDIGPSGQLHVIYAAHNILANVNVDLEKHPYVMSDHGLFIAGIIGTIAPNAKMHLIEVLNPFGVGSLETIAQGFEQVVAIKNNLAPGTALVINCSLMLTIPSDAGQLTAQQAAAEDIDTLDLEEAQQMATILQAICALVSPPPSQPSTQPPTIMIAAAGNDSDPSSPRKQARYPAAYANVTGVGALMRDDTPTIYSNVADDPDILGFAVIGGETAAASGPNAPLMTAQDGGILGAFISPLPSDGQPDQQTENLNGWARWAGTSFATPIISGLFARLLGGANHTTFAAIAKALRDSHELVNIGEVVHVEQR